MIPFFNSLVSISLHVCFLLSRFYSCLKSESSWCFLHEQQKKLTLSFCSAFLQTALNHGRISVPWWRKVFIQAELHTDGELWCQNCCKMEFIWSTTMLLLSGPVCGTEKWRNLTVVVHQRQQLHEEKVKRSSQNERKEKQKNSQHSKL